MAQKCEQRQPCASIGIQIKGIYCQPCPEQKKYIASGEAEGVDKGYKTSIRDDWFVIPSIKLSDALFLRRNHLFPRLVLNTAKAYTTDTMHRVFFKQSTNHKAFVASYYNSFSFAHAEIVGRNFGGGVLELMPSEVESIFLPYNEDNAEIFDEIDAGISGKTAQLVAEKLNTLAKTHQIICITHLPQIAAMADNHYVIEKSTKDNRTISNITQLSYDESVNEISRMLGGSVITDAVISNAKELKNMAQLAKKELNIISTLIYINTLF